jgi:hypothetical protein
MPDAVQLGINTLKIHVISGADVQVQPGGLTVQSGDVGLQLSGFFICHFLLQVTDAKRA